MKKMRKKKKPISAEATARMADQGKVTGGQMMNPFQRVNVDFTAEMLRELDKPEYQPPDGHQDPRSRGLGQEIFPARVTWREILASVVRRGPVERRQNRTSCFELDECQP
jgi:hypothetical protein